jgi:hypothetical protein
VTLIETSAETARTEAAARALAEAIAVADEARDPDTGAVVRELVGVIIAVAEKEAKLIRADHARAQTEFMAKAADAILAQAEAAATARILKDAETEAHAVALATEELSPFLASLERLTESTQQALAMGALRTWRRALVYLRALAQGGGGAAP